jgi:hypothetical protein
MNKNLLLPLLLFLACVFFFCVSGRQASPDEEDYYRSALRFIKDGSIRSEQMKTVPEGHFLVKGKDGHSYSIFGTGLLPFHTPFVVAGKLISVPVITALKSPRSQPYADEDYPNAETRLGFSFSGPFFTLLIILFTFKSAIYFGMTNRHAAVCALLTALSTPLLAYTKTAFRDIPLTAFLTGALLETLRCSHSKRPVRASIAGALAGLAFLAKEQAGLNAVFSAVYLWFVAGTGFMLWFLAGFFSGALPLLAFKTLVLGNPLAPLGGSFSDLLSTPFLTGFFGLTFSPGKGLFIYSPFLIFGLTGIYKLWKLRKNEEDVSEVLEREIAFIFFNLLAFLVISSLFWHWHGGLCWGPRLIIPLIPWLGIAAMYAFRYLKASGKTLFVAFCLWGLVVNIAGLSLDWHLFHALREYRDQIIENGYEHEFFNTIAFSFSDTMIIAGLKKIAGFEPSPVHPKAVGTIFEKAWKAQFIGTEFLIAEAIAKRHFPYILFGVLMLSVGFAGIIIAIRPC